MGSTWVRSQNVFAAANTFVHTNKNPEQKLWSFLLSTLPGMGETEDNIMSDDSFRCCDWKVYHPTKKQQNQQLPPCRAAVINRNSRSGGQQQQQQQQQQQPQQQQQHAHEEFLPILKELATKEVSDVIITRKFRQIQQQMKTRGLVTDLSFVQISRDVVRTKIVDAVEEAATKRELKGYHLF